MSHAPEIRIDYLEGGGGVVQVIPLEMKIQVRCG